ncbi:UDP-N-acetylglucosamine--N-acetylmuramyl-(pentapeptide) pyrophosphoryl-undecaprenol N-acetylglucosamine transferase [Rhodovulum sp. DZ06]|uniref:UDP-N-acetylglucosamine--N-acetylmuramyl- (pentapeptide) pyrophosphoryl-undecaprenol N-acetylglucosamine transferase n=1 Tax=Rhodovulum sp. DZ06 TaxID=3425126 RepID=UPI003D329241
MTAPHLVIAAGGTGGHMFPAQALAQEALRRGWRVTLSTDPRGARYAGGFPAAVERRQTSSSTFARGGIGAKLSAPFAILGGVAATASWFAKDRPSVVAGFGGYPSLPALSAATLLGVPRLIHEQNGVLGRVNRAFAPRVAAVACGTWPLSNPPSGATLVQMGNPVRDDALVAAETAYVPPAETGPLNLLVFGGSQGAAVTSRVVPEAIGLLPDDLRARLTLTQQVRDEDMERVRARYGELGVTADLAPFFACMPERIADAQLVIARAGASTIAELTAIGRPSILIPYPSAMDDHQTANARPLGDAGAAVLAPETGPDPLTAESLSAQIAAILSDPARASSMAAAAKGLGRPTAAADLADLALRIMNREPIT